MERIDEEFSTLKRRVYEECRRLNHRYSTPTRITVERNNDAWEYPAFKLIDPSGKTYFLFAPSSDVKRQDVIVWMGLERWRVSGTNRMQDRIIVDAQQEDVADSVQADELADLMPILRRNVFERDLPRLLSESADKNRPLGLLMIDLDSFKSFNDQHGHQIGDEVLKECARIVSAAIEGKGKAYRYGGEEIVVLLPNFSCLESTAVGETLRKSIEAATMTSKQLKVTVSIGMACMPDHANEGDALVKRADEALYRAKGLGRNLVRVSGEPEDVVQLAGEVKRRQPDPGKLSEDQRNALFREYLTEGRAKCPRDGVPLRFIDATTHDSKTQEFLISCPYCGLNDHLPG